MNDYARVRSKNEKKKKQEKIVSLFFLIGSKLPSFLVRRFEKEERKKREESVGIRFSRIVSNNTRHKRRRRAHRRGVNARRNQKEETEKRS